MAPTQFRGEIWFQWGELPGSSTNQPGYVFSTGSFGADKPIDIDSTSPFVDLKHGDGTHTVIFTIQFNGTNVEQAHIPELTSGVAYAAMGAIELVDPVYGNTLYAVNNGVANYNSGNGKIRLTLRTDNGRSA